MVFAGIQMDQQRADLIKFLRQETSIHILPPPPAKQANQSPIGQFATYYLAVEVSTTFRDIKILVQEKEGIPADEQILTNSDHWEYDDALNLFHYGWD
ncbi:hypothetical protein M3Y94_00939500 [Aphelenchoides besseyi]|nr:hypothetical protein M3Y94_00939500 [Aphelenchoides besseyi]